MKKFFIGFLLVVFSSVIVLAQTTTGRLSGTVSSPDGVLPGATVSVTDSKTGKELTATTSGDGTFLFPQLEFGSYTVKVTASGFKTYIATDVKIDVGREYTLSPTLELGNVQESVTVTAGADVVTSGTAQVSNTVSPQQILSLPLLTRNPLTLAGLQAGVSANSAQNTTVNGMRTTFTNITRDGINIQDTFIRSNATDFAPGRPSVDDTGEFTIATANQEADQGYGGAQIRLVTPRGEKNFHGALFAYNRNSRFAANNFFNNKTPNNPDGSQADLAKRPPFRNRNQFGGKISGPMPVPGFGEGTPFLFKDKGFFFFAYEGIRDPLTDTNIARGNRTILLPVARAGGLVFNRTNSNVVSNPFVSCPSTTVGSNCTITNLLGFAQSIGLTVPSTIDPTIQSAVISQLPTTPNTTGIGDNLNTAGYYVARRSDQKRNQYSSRIDVDFNDKNSILGIFNYNKESNLRPDADTTKFSVIPGVIQTSANKQFTMAYRWVGSSNFVNELRGGLFSSDVPFIRTDDVPSYLLTNLISTYPVNTFLNQGRNTKAYNLQDNADWVLGKHTLRFGVQFQVFKVDAYNDAATVPTITIGTGTATPTFTQANFSSVGGISTSQLGTANNLLALFGGIFNQVTQSFNIVDPSTGFQRGATALTPFRYENHSLYVADKWAIKSNLTLNLGVRYELFPGLRLINDLALEPVLDPNDPIASLLNPAGTYNVIGTNAGRKHAYYKTDKDNFAPNVGFAWSPNFEKGIGKLFFDKTVIRGGYSWVYGNDSIVTSINNAGVGNSGLGRTPVTQQNLNGRLSGSIPTIPLPSNPVLPRTYLQNNAVGVGNFFGTVFGIDPNLQTPRVQQYSFGIQREFFGNTAVEARYVGTRSNNLGRGIDLNQIDIFNNGFLADFQRALSNFRVSQAANPTNSSAWTAFCSGVYTGCVPLTIFQSGGSAGAGHLVVGTGGLSASTFNNNLTNGTPADLAISFINSAANFNNQPSSANPSAVPYVKFLPNPATGVVDYFCNCGSYNYNSLQLEVRRRFAHGLYFQANYTFSKNLTDAVGTSQNLFEPYLNNNDKHLDYQRADYDLTHSFNFNGIYQLPFGKGKLFLNQGGLVDKIFGGWELSGLWQWSSGAPITFVDTRGTLNRTARSGRQTPVSTLTNEQIRALGGVFRAANGNVYFIDPSVINTTGRASEGFGQPAFNGQVFFNVDPGQTGNVTRAVIDGPGYFNVNLALLKNINFSESGVRLQLRMEAFNAFNNVNFIQNTQFPSITSTTFGQITSTSDPRILQFAARFEF